MVQMVLPEQVCECLRQWSIIDVRSKEEYNRNHIEGARWISPYNALKVVREKFNQDEKFVLYDHSAEDIRAHRVADLLANAGFTGVSVLEGGYTAWAEHKYPNAKVNNSR